MRSVGEEGDNGEKDGRGGASGVTAVVTERRGEVAEPPPPGYVVALPLLRPVWRSLPHAALAAGAGLGLLLAGVPRMLSVPADPWLCLNLLRAAALALALGLAFLLDDPARHTTAPVPTGRAVRIGLRVGCVLPLAAVWWTAALFLIPEKVRPPVGATTLEAAAFAVLALAGAVVAVRHSEATEPGITVSAGLLGASFAAALLLPGRWALWVATADPHWDDAHRRWAGLLVVAALTGAFSLTEPLRRRRTMSLAHR
ncbi:ABC transporter [Streptomyces sp. NPDC002580]|uniref:ABC transporter n=1 Tax=Streptomyces sp. NPDC002580 TaxID=3364653 RepID=UPI0036C3406B